MRSSMMISMVAALPLNVAGTAMAAYGGLPPKFHGEWCLTYFKDRSGPYDRDRAKWWFETCKSMQSDDFRKNVFDAIPGVTSAPPSLTPAGKRQEPSRIVLDENGMSSKFRLDTVGEVQVNICKSTDVVPDFIEPTLGQPSRVERWIVRFSCRVPSTDVDGTPETYRFTRKDPGETGSGPPPAAPLGYRYGGPGLVMEDMRSSDWDRSFSDMERHRKMLEDAYKSPPP